jgi:hypothetical protein
MKRENAAVETILSGVLISPAFAQMSADDMSCADFTAMDSSGQMAAVDKLGAMKSGDSGAMSSAAMSSHDKASGKMASDRAPVTAESVAAACADHPDMTVHEAMMAH